MKKDDGLSKYSFLEVDDKINEGSPNVQFKNKSIYLLHYPKGNIIKKSEGIIKSIKEDNYNILHSCDSSSGSSGGPLINFINFKVVGIHKGGAPGGKNWNVATFIREPIQKFIEKYKTIIIKKISDDLKEGKEEERKENEEERKENEEERKEIEETKKENEDEGNYF